MALVFKIVGGIIALLVLAVVAAASWLVLDGRRGLGGEATYVALGSSFAAGPGVQPTDPNSPMMCGRSAHNYAHLLAEELGLSLIDRTCGGATTENILRRGQYLQSPQINSVRAETQLVTVTIGGNDIGYIGNLMAWSCINDPASVPHWMPKSVCKPLSDTEGDARIANLGASLRAIMDAVRARAPHARIVFIDYATVLPEGDACPGLPLTAEQLARGRRLAAELARVTAETATAAGIDLVRASELSRGHDACAADPWVFGWTLPARPFQNAPFAYHPNERAMRAIAAALKDLLKDERSAP
jgi:lysophospholipase L1-like esterase